MGKKDPPDTPDYVGAAREQAESSEQVTNQQTWANRPNQNTPWGSLTWESSPTVDPATGQPVTQWTQNMELSPMSQEALSGQQRLQAGRTNLAEGLLGRAEQEFGAPMDWESLPEYGQTPEGSSFSTVNADGMQAVNPSSRYAMDAADAIYGQFSRRMDPQFQRDTDALDTKLVNMGFQRGDEGYDRELAKMRQSQNDMRLNAMDQATIRSGQEAARYHGMDTATRAQQFDERGTTAQFNNTAGQQRFNQQMTQANYANTLRQQALAEQMQRRGFSLNEINAILHGQQVATPNMPNFMGAERSSEAQLLAATGMGYQAELDAFNAEQAAIQGMMQGISSMNPFSF